MSRYLDVAVLVEHENAQAFLTDLMDKWADVPYSIIPFIRNTNTKEEADALAEKFFSLEGSDALDILLIDAPLLTNAEKNNQLIKLTV